MGVLPVGVQINTFIRQAMAGETGRDREGPSPPGPINFTSCVGPGGTKYITKIDPFYFSWAVFQQL